MFAKIKAISKSKGYVLYTRPFELNIVGLRSRNTSANKFDDEIHVFYKTDKKKWNYHLFKATTDQGTFWLNNPSYPQGTAILKEGQYKNAYALGLHQGKYEALVQVRPVTVMRDFDRDSTLDFKNGSIDKGMFGINIHRASSTGKTLFVDKYSAGCQVFQSAGDFLQFIKLCEVHRSLYGNSFAYTLLDFRAVQKRTIRSIAIMASVLTTFIMGFIFRPKLKRRKKKNKYEYS